MFVVVVEKSVKPKLHERSVKVAKSHVYSIRTRGKKMHLENKFLFIDGVCLFVCACVFVFELFECIEHHQPTIESRGWGRKYQVGKEMLMWEQNEGKWCANNDNIFAYEVNSQHHHHHYSRCCCRRCHRCHNLVANHVHVTLFIAFTWYG